MKLFTEQKADVQRMAVTIRDVAQAAGVSTGTASQVLNGRDGVSGALAERVLRSAAELSYRHRNRQRQANERLVRRIGFVTSDETDIARRPVYAAILAGAAAECDDLGMSVTYQPVAGVGAAARLAERGLDGLILAGYLEQDVLDAIVASDLPVVLASHDPVAACDRVVFDDAGGGRAAATLLLAQGHRRLGVIHGPLEHPTVRHRFDGFVETVERWGGARWRPAQVPPAGQNAAGGYTAAQALFGAELSAGIERPTAVFCTSARMAVGLLRALHEYGLRVPEEVSVAGFGVLDASALPYPGLTLAEGDTRQLGRMAVRRLIERVREPEAAPVRVVLGVTLLERESVASPPV